MSIKNIIKKFLPTPILAKYSKISKERKMKYEARLIESQPDLHRKAVEKVRAKKGPINVIYFALMDSVWKYDVLYRLMEKDERFNPVILVCPVVNYGRENMLLNMDKCYNLFKSRGYNVIRSYDAAEDKYVDVRKDLKPDVIFYTNPYEGLIDNRYFIKQFTDILTCYSTYSITQSNRFDIKFSSLFSNILWKDYIEFSYLKEKARSFVRGNVENIVFTGFPGIDRFIKDGETFEDSWPIKDKRVKRIIWAPHHTITDYTFVTYSTFLIYCEFMFEIAEKYRDKIQIAFKPHPLLKNRLKEMWGENETQRYYDKWAELTNGMLEDGKYEDLFMTSDAIIHDSGSFIIEYLYTKKPAMYLSNGRSFDQQYNEFAQKCLSNYYLGKNKEDIERFVQNVIKDYDPLKQKRLEFYNYELLPPNGKLASENIIEDIVESLDLKPIP